MNILFYSTFENKNMWLNLLKKKFRAHKIFTTKDKFDFKKIDVAIVWNLPNPILKKLLNIKIIFSLGAGVDHILKLPNYNQTPVIRIKDPYMRERMFNHTLSQILIYQLKLSFYQKAQQKNFWVKPQETPLNNDLVIGVLGLGYIGGYVAKKLNNLGYKVIGYKNTISKSNKPFRKFFGKQINQFLSLSDIVVSILPSTKHTDNFINIDFLKKMKKKSLLINIGRGNSLNEDDLLRHIKFSKNFFASLDVFKKEPLMKKHKFWKNPNIIITPHVAAITDINSSINYMYSRFLSIKNNKIKSDINIKKGY